MRCVARRAPSERVRRFSDRSLKRAVKAAALADEKLDVILGPREKKIMKHHSRAEMQGRLDAFSRGEDIALPARFNLQGEAEVKKRRPRMRANPRLSEPTPSTSQNSHKNLKETTLYH